VRKAIKILLLIVVIFGAACLALPKSFDAMYSDQEALFTENRLTFELARSGLQKLKKVPDTAFSIDDKFLELPDSLISSLRRIGIKEISLFHRACGTKELRFTPDSSWHVESFSVVYIGYSKCNELGAKGFHGTVQGSDHKHSFGQGGGWYIYSDSDRDPF
jgi:hypothetical protein